MYILTTVQQGKLEKFLSKIPENIVKGRYAEWINKIILQGWNVTRNDLANFKSMAHSLDVTCQHFPGDFVNEIINGIASDSKNVDKSHIEAVKKEAEDNAALSIRVKSQLNQKIEPIAHVEEKKVALAKKK